MSDNIKVVVKVRPLISRELEDKQHHQWRVNNNTLFQLDINGRDFGQAFTFDKVYSENTKTSDVYNDVAKPIVQAAVAGFNGTIFAYGQTSSGKTYTMTGTDESPGIIPLAVLNLFETIKNVPGRDFVVSVSYIEIYNETLRDLLDIKKKVKIHDTYNNSIKVDATEKVTASTEEVLEAMKKGNENRHTGSTNMNESSSRSHSIFQINIESREHIEGEEQAGCVNVSQLNLVDLAGSERAGQTGATGLRFKEGTLINKSLTSLAHVIKQLSEEPNKFINYRDSNLTRILQNSLGGNAKTCIICAITPAALEETNSTLQFATRAKTIKNKPEVNAVATDATMIQKLTKELSKLQSQLEQKKNLEEILETKKNREQTLQNEIANLQRLILNGFGQRPNAELIGGARRKLIPPRRVTISTLHSFEDDCPKVPRFCTPALKYNPSLVQNPPDFVPLNNPTKLSSVPEEPPRLVTPPPNERKINTGGDVIELLDSDDDESSSAQLCSPYHECFGATKTPPCVLRKNAKQAEKNLKDLVELTDREKMYTPSVVELIEKLENSTSNTVKLQDEIEVLKTISKEKDFEIEQLKSRINTTEQEITRFTSVASELQTQHKEFSTQLTDWEVSYERLKNKAKLREQELLSLLEEQNVKQAKDIGKMLLKPKDQEIIHFMDMSKDISLVNSDNESSIVQPDEIEPTERTNIILLDMQAQLAAKNQIISELEIDINSQKGEIKRLEKSSHDLLGQVNSFKEKLRYLENENALLQSTVNELNCTIKSQKENLELGQNDMNSYVGIIQELQIKLTKKENMLNTHIGDTLLESMLANEDKTIANNENLKNIILAFKLALENSKKEIDSLKSRMQNNNESGDKEKLKKKTREVEVLNDEISKFTKQASENMVTINTLLQEKSSLVLIEKELIKKISEVEQRNSEHDILSKEQAMQIVNLKKEIEKLTSFLADKDNSNECEDLLKQIHEATRKVKVLEGDIEHKDTLIASLNTRNNEYENCLNKAKLAINKLQDVFLVLTGEVREIPDILDSFKIIYNTLNENLTILENVAVETVSQKDLAQKNSIELKKEMDAMVLQHKLQILDVTETKKNLSESVQKLSNEIKLLNDKKSEQASEIEKLKLELNKMQLNAANCEKDFVISSLKENEIVLLEKIKELEFEVVSMLKSKEDMNVNFSNKEKQFKHLFKELEDKLQQKSIELTNAEQQFLHNENENDLLVENIISKLSNMIDNIKENNLSVTNRLMNYDCSDIREHILPILDVVVDHVIMQSPVEIENEELKSELEVISNYNEGLKCDLKQSSELLQNLQEELKIKAAEINSMEHKAKEWKKQFSDFDMSMKEQMLFLQLENKNLKTRHQELNKETKMQFDVLAAEKNALSSQNKAFSTSGSESENNGANLSPPSLLDICVNTIVEAINPKQNDIISETTSSLCVKNINSRSSANTCPECDQLNLELRTIEQDNIRLLDNLEQLEISNKELLKEQNDIRDEVRLLVELTHELQKKLVNHRVNLSILTATTYAENKSLKSQVKGLQHHHSRFHNVCQRDIPEFKRQLNELMFILKDDTSFCDGLNFSYKRYSLPNLQENNSSICHNRNESTFDGDLLMLDNNVTLTTADTTLVGYNQTCLDLTQTIFNETGVQTVDQNLIEPNTIHRYQIQILKKENENLSSLLEELKVENMELKEQLTKCLVKESKEDAQCSPIKMSSLNDETKHQNNQMEYELLKEQLIVVTKQKEVIEKRYNDLSLEMPSTDALIHKMRVVEEDLKKKVNELSIVTDTLNAKSKQVIALQEENDSLSTQVFETVSDVDDLNKQLEKLKKQNQVLLNQCQELELGNKSKVCDRPQCDVIPIEAHSKLRNSEKNNSKLNSSLCDSDSISRFKKINTLRSEIHAGLEDCKVFTEDIATQRHLDQSNMSMDLDESINFELANESLTGSPQSKHSTMLDIQEQPLDLYTVEKNDCCNFYSDKTGMVKDNLASNIKIIEIMQLLYDTLVTRHGNEVENLVNKLNDYQETQDKLLAQISDMDADFSKINRDLGEKDKSLNYITNVVTQLKENLSHMPVNSKPFNLEAYANIMNILKTNFFSILDTNFNLSSVYVFDQISGHINKLIEDYNSVSEVLTQTKCHLSEREKECILLKNQNETIREINNAVTLDIVNKEQENITIIKKTYNKLVELEMISPDKVPLTEPVNVHVLISLLEHFINKYKNEKAKVELSFKMNDSKAALEEKEIQMKELQSNIEVLKSVNNKNTGELAEKNDKIKKLEVLQHELKSAFNNKVEENDRNLKVIENLIEETKKLKATVHYNDQMIISLSGKEAEAKELLNTVSSLQEDYEKLKAMNEMISKEAKSYASELEKSLATIKQNNIDIDKMTADILVLRESMKDATVHVDKLKQEVQILQREKVEIKNELDIKSRDCSRLEINIKTHEKTAEIQSRMIMRLQKLKEVDDKANSETQVNLTEQYTNLQTECEALKNTMKALYEEIENLRIAKESLENRLTESEESGRRSRTSMDAIAESSKRRRQSLHDSKRLFDKLEEHKNLEAVFESRQNPDDLFMDVDDDNSGRSTPFGLGKGRDSLLSRTDHSDKDEEHSSRPSSVLARATRRRRQSSHDLHRSVTPHALSPTDLSGCVIGELQQNRLLSDNEITQLRTQLASCEKELEDLKERYRELDEECETCSEYLRERDEQCSRLKKEKASLQNQVTELKTQADSARNSFSFKMKPSVAHVSVNTDEDWTNLHAVVVDRMSYDAEVEKNKKLTKTIEELRFTKLELKNTLAKMQKALDKNAAKDHSRELDDVKQELKSSKDELKDLRMKYKELDEECETCSNYLKEREEQCRQLKEAKATLEARLKLTEAKLDELQEKSHTIEHTKSVRKKRQTIHDMNRPETSTMEQIDASTETTHDLSPRVSRDYRQEAGDDSSRDAKYLIKVVEQLTQQNSHLEHQLRVLQVAQPMFVATGSAIVQNQQITDVMKENQKLKKINAKLVTICKKRGKSANRENEDPCEQGGK